MTTDAKPSKTVSPAAAILVSAVAGLAIATAAGIALAVPVGTYLKSRNDARHVVQMARQADAQERIAAALERAYPVPPDVDAQPAHTSAQWRIPNSVWCNSGTGPEACK